MIMSDAFISYTVSQGTEFSKQVSKHIRLFQDSGLIVEIQYSATVDFYSALIVGRKKEVTHGQGRNQEASTSQDRQS